MKKPQQLIYYKESISNKINGYMWAWKESADKNVFGWVPTLDDIKRDALRMFPDKEISLLHL